MFRPVQSLVFTGVRRSQPTLLSRTLVTKSLLRCPTHVQKLPTHQQARLVQPLQFQSLRFFSEESDKGKEGENAPKAADETEGQEATEEENTDATNEKSVEEKAAEEKAELEGQLAEMKKELQYALAEIENTRVRGRNDVEKARKYAIQSFAKQLLDVADNLHRAVDSVPSDDLKKEGADHHLVSLYEGVEMTQAELQKVFKANGITEFGEEGEQFDPNFHEAMFQAPDETKEPNTIS